LHTRRGIPVQSGPCPYVCAWNLQPTWVLGVDQPGLTAHDEGLPLLGVIGH
jgi:hypothetical protein